MIIMVEDTPVGRENQRIASVPASMSIGGITTNPVADV
jgi:hypothetical protein